MRLPVDRAQWVTEIVKVILDNTTSYSHVGSSLDPQSFLAFYGFQNQQKAISKTDLAIYVKLCTYVVTGLDSAGVWPLY